MLSLSPFFGFFIAIFNCHRSLFLAGSCFFWRILKNNKCIFSYMVLKLFPSLPPRLTKIQKYKRTKKNQQNIFVNAKLWTFFFFLNNHCARSVFFFCLWLFSFWIFFYWIVLNSHCKNVINWRNRAKKNSTILPALLNAIVWIRINAWVMLMMMKELLNRWHIVRMKKKRMTFQKVHAWIHTLVLEDCVSVKNLSKLWNLEMPRMASAKHTQTEWRTVPGHNLHWMHYLSGRACTRIILKRVPNQYVSNCSILWISLE